MSNILNYLFETNAIKFCKENEPFCYTSGKIGPYFFNSQFVYGSETEANDFLNYITAELELIKNNTSLKEKLPNRLLDKVSIQYENNKIYNDVINQMKTYIENNIGIDNFDYISGGERRDWFFSIILAHLLNKPHLTIFKDMSALCSNSEFTQTNDITNLNGSKVLHIADLITTASSYIKMWIPIIKNLNGKMENTLVLIDRNQGGKDILKDVGVLSHSLAIVDESLFQEALNLGVINAEQLSLIKKYFNNPDETMRDFLLKHPEFIENALKSTNERTLKRVHTLVDEDLYNLNNK